MSAPLPKDVRADDAFLYAPPWARDQSPRPEDDWPPLSRMRPVRSPSEPAMPMGLGGPNIALPRRLRRDAPFEGDVAMVELRRRLSLEPDIVPEPPIRIRPEPAGRLLSRLSFMLLASAVSAYGLTMLFSRGTDPSPPSATGAAPPAAAAAFKSDFGIPARLVVEGRRAFANEPLPLGLTLAGASGEEFVLLKGLAAGTRLSAGTELAPRSWRVPARELASVAAVAPRDYIGTMDAAVDLHAGSRLVDSQVIRLEWVENTGRNPASPKSAEAKATRPVVAKQTLEPAEVAMLIKRGQDLLRSGNISSARLLLRRAANSGSADAAFMLGSTFDPDVLAEIGVLGFAPNAEQARDWYAKASDLGSSEAARRLERLGSSGGP